MRLAAGSLVATTDALLRTSGLAHGAEQVLIDGAVDRRAASSPQVSDGLVLATGAALDRDIDEVVLQRAMPSSSCACRRSTTSPRAGGDCASSRRPPTGAACS